MPMIKIQDCIILLKIICRTRDDYTQHQLAEQLGISLAEVNASLKRLVNATLLHPTYYPHVVNSSEFLLRDMPYVVIGCSAKFINKASKALEKYPDERFQLMLSELELLRGLY